MNKEATIKKYKGYTILVRYSQYTNRANGYNVFTTYGTEFFKTLARAKSFIDIIN